MRAKAKGMLAVGLILVAAATTALAQVSAKQGASEEFTSPMILDVPLQKFLAAPKGAPWTTVETKDYVCDGVLLPAVTLTPGKSSERAIDVLLFARNGWGKDKEVTVKLEVVAGEKVLATAFVPRFELEEKQSKKRKASLFLRGRGEQEPILRITLGVYSD